MNSKEALKIQAVINILNHEQSEIESHNEVDDKYYYWYILGSTAEELTEILKCAQEVETKLEGLPMFESGIENIVDTQL